MARTLLAVPRGWPSLVWLVVLALTGCWTAPVASVQAKGDSRLIQDEVAVVALKGSAVVQSVDATARQIVLSAPGDGAAVSYRVGPEVRTLERIKAGDEVRARIKEELSVYVLRDGLLLRPGSLPQAIASNARVLSTEPSYRLLTLQFSNGLTETLKVGRSVKLDEMASGDDVVIKPVEIIDLQVRR